MRGKVEWRVKALGDVCSLIGGGTPSKKNGDFYKGEIPWATVRDMKQDHITRTEFKITEDAVRKSSTNIIKAGNVIIATRVGLGKVCLINQDTAINQDLRGILPIRSDVLTVRFLFWWLKSIAHLIVEEGTGATVKGVKLPFVKSLQIPLPPLPEQKRIVAILDEAFTGISQALANAEKNLANARELFESYLNKIFTRKGEGWVEKKLSDLTKKVTKGSSPKWQGINYVEEPGILFVTSENVDLNKMNYKKIKFVEEAFNEKDSKSILKKGDVLTNIVGASIGRTAIFDRDDAANINQAVCLIRCNQTKLMNKYLAYLLNSPFFRQVLHDNEIDNARANLSLGFFRSLEIPVPSLKDQGNIVECINEVSTETQHLETIYKQKLTALAELKQSILQKAFAGKLTMEPK